MPWYGGGAGLALGIIVILLDENLTEQPIIGVRSLHSQLMYSVTYKMWCISHALVLDTPR